MKSLQQIADAIHARVEGNGTMVIRGARSVDSARPGDLTFLVKGRSPPVKERFRASAVIVHNDESASLFPEGTALLRIENPHLGFKHALDFLYPRREPPFRGIDPTAIVQANVTLGVDVCIGPHAFVGAGARIGDRSTIYPGACVGPECRIAEDVVIHAQVTLYDGTSVGARSVIHAGAVIGADGFGFVTTQAGHAKIQQLGHVRIEEDVEIGANSTVDRGALDDTVIGRGSKIDNLVHIGHNCIIGENCLICAQVGLAGSSRLGDGVVLGGQVGLAGHLTVGDGAQIGAQAGVHTDVPAGAKYLGSPAINARTAARAFSVIPQLPDLRKELDQLRRRLAELWERVDLDDDVGYADGKDGTDGKDGADSNASA